MAIPDYHNLLFFENLKIPDYNKKIIHGGDGKIVSVKKLRNKHIPDYRGIPVVIKYELIII